METQKRTADKRGVRLRAAHGAVGVIVLVCLLLVPVPAGAQLDNEVRLRDGTGPNNGVVEIFHIHTPEYQRWGMVCDDYWDEDDGDVACKQMGFSTGADSVSTGNQYTGTAVWLDNLDCNGNESGLHQCDRLGDLLWGENNCTLSQGAGLMCSGQTTNNKVFVERATLTITEGNSKSYGIALGKEPSGAVTVEVSELAGVTVSPTSLTFTTMNYKVWQDVTVTVPEDEDRNDLTVTITHDATGGGYGSTDPPSVMVQGRDDERVPERVTPKPEVSSHSDTAVRVRWTVPDGRGLPITGYVVQYQKAGESEAWRNWPHDGTGWAATLTDLEVGTEYEVRVKARNESGRSVEWSEVGRGTTAVVPDRPATPTVQPLSASQLEVRWTAPNNNGFPITDYDIRFRPNVPGTHWDYRYDRPASSRRIVLSSYLGSGLQASTQYEVEVRAQNVGGASPWARGFGTTAASDGSGSRGGGGGGESRGSGGGGGGGESQGSGDGSGDGSGGGESQDSGGSGGGSTSSEPVAPDGHLENPGPESFQSGIGVISGWACTADTVVIEIDGLAYTAAYGTERADTQAACGDTDNGFGLLFNWNLLGDGEHEVVAYVDGVELARTTVTVTTLGEEFLEDAAGTCVAEDFPSVGESIALVWQEANQNFVLAGGAAPDGVNQAGTGDGGSLENPGPNSFQSGIGIISGWVCTATAVEVEFETEGGDVHRFEAAYGTERADTLAACGDTDNGFGLSFNWNLLGDGEHEVIALADGMEFDRATVRVTTLGEEFVRDVAGACLVEDFPMPGETVTLEWQQSSQNFVMTRLE